MNLWCMTPAISRKYWTVQECCLMFNALTAIEMKNDVYINGNKTPINIQTIN